jgi:hypothetical protein
MHCPDSSPLSSKLPESIRQRSQFARAARADIALCALTEGLALLAAGVPFDDSFRHALVLARIRERSGAPAEAAYLEGCRKLEESIQKGNQQ